MPMNSELDHLVVMSPTLDEGVRWCEATLGVTPGPGGSHPLMGTHNRLLRIDGPGFEHAYLEIIAVDPMAVPTREPGLKRWFDLDDPALIKRLALHGPQLCHWVARTPDVEAARTALRPLGIERGPVLSASRTTPAGLLEWKITVRDDGHRLFGGALPTLIQWGAVHPVGQMAPCAVRLQALRLQHREAARLSQALSRLGLINGQAIAVEEGPRQIEAWLETPVGRVHLGDDSLEQRPQ
jgi:hypothetical protein